MERLIDPVLADLQAEYRCAIGQDRVWKSRWLRMAGYVVLLKALAFYGCDRTIGMLRNGTAHDRQAFARTIGFSTAAIVAVTLLLLAPPAQSIPGNYLVYLIPQALPLAIPVGFTLGILCALGGRVVSRAVQVALLAMALAWAVVSFATMAWMVPAAGQAFRVSLAEHVRLTKGQHVSLTKGASEMTLSELREGVDSLTHASRERDARTLAFQYQQRWALPLAAFALTLFAICIFPRRPLRVWVVGAATCGACFAYFALLAAGNVASRQGTLPVFAAAWLPNLVFAVASTVSLVVTTYKSKPLHA